MKMFKKIKNIHKYFLLNILFVLSFFIGCVPEQPQKQVEGACSSDKSINPKTRRCESLILGSVPPQNLTKVINMVEDINQWITLAYEDLDSDMAIQLEITNIPFGGVILTPGVYPCPGGSCQVFLNIGANFNGVAEFSYRVMDKDGWSPISRVRVEVSPVDDGPEILSIVPAAPTLVEDTQQSFTLNYEDAESDLVTMCEMTELPYSVNAFSNIGAAATQCSTSCNLDQCFFTIAPKPNFVGTGQFKVRVFANGKWSLPANVNVVYTAINDAPVLPSSQYLYPSIAENDPTLTPVTIVLPYTDADGDLGQSCIINLTTTALEIVQQSGNDCACDGSGVCKTLIRGKSDNHRNKKTFVSPYISGSATDSFKLEYSIYDGAARSSTSPLMSLDVFAVNDAPIWSNSTDYVNLGLTCPENDQQILTDYGEQIDPLTNPCLSIPLSFDENGLEDEDSQAVYIRVKSNDNSIVKGMDRKLSVGFSDTGIFLRKAGVILTQGSGDSILTAIENRYGSGFIKIGLSSSFFNSSPVSTASNDSNINDIRLSIIPEYDMSSSSQINLLVEMADVQGTDIAYSTYSVPLQIGEINNPPRFVRMPEKCPIDLTSCNSSVCLGRDSPVNLGINVLKNNSLFWDRKNLTCYRSNLSTNTWEEFYSECPISLSSVEQGCQHLGASCIGVQSPQSSVLAKKVQSYYYDRVASKCYVSTAANRNDRWEEITNPRNCIASSVTTEKGCNAVSVAGNRCIGTNSPISLGVIPQKVGSIFYDRQNQKCYRSTGRSSRNDWTEIFSINKQEHVPYQILPDFSGTKRFIPPKCLVSSISFETNCSTLGQYCLGNQTPNGLIVPSKIGSVFYDYTNDKCYVAQSIGGTWLEQSNVHNLQGEPWIYAYMNEKGAYTIDNLFIDEGGGPTEDAQNLNLELSLFDDDPDQIVSSGLSPISIKEDVKVFYGGVEIAPDVLSGDNFGRYNLETKLVDIKNNGSAQQKAKIKTAIGVSNSLYDSENDSLFYELKIVLTRIKDFAPGISGRIRIKLKIRDDDAGLDPDFISSQITRYIEVNVFPVSIKHNGWTKLNSMGGISTHLGARLNDNVSTYQSTGSYSHLEWETFNLLLSSDESDPLLIQNFSSYTSVGISHFNIYRRLANDLFDYSKPLNKSPIDSSVFEFVDGSLLNLTVGTLNPELGPPVSGQVYYYQIVPIDNKNFLPIIASELDSVARITIPFENQAFVHRWMANKQMCEKMHLTPNHAKNYTCEYHGPGDTDQYVCNAQFDKNVSITSLNPNIFGPNPPPLSFTPQNHQFYFDINEKLCYAYIPTSSTWSSFKSLCDVTPTSLDAGCTSLGENCMGTLAPNDPLSPVTAQRKGSYYLQYVDSGSGSLSSLKCWRSKMANSSSWEEAKDKNPSTSDTSVKKHVYDLKMDLIVDRFEAGCNYVPGGGRDTAGTGACDSPNGCIGENAPAEQEGDSGTSIYYNRSTGVCHYKGLNGWSFVDNYSTASEQLKQVADLSRFANLPPLVQVRQRTASEICRVRSPLTFKVTESSTASVYFKLPSRKMQMAYSSWESGITDEAVDELERGVALSSLNSKCNSSEASGLENDFVNNSVSRANFHTLPGTDNSSIRSLWTGSEHTKNCQSEFGIQDIIGNVKEWVSDRLFCTNEKHCEFVTTKTKGISCNFTIHSDTMPYYNNPQNQDENDFTSATCNDKNRFFGSCIGKDVNLSTPDKVGLVAFDTKNHSCYVSGYTSNPLVYQWVPIQKGFNCNVATRNLVELDQCFVAGSVPGEEAFSCVAQGVNDVLSSLDLGDDIEVLIMKATFPSTEYMCRNSSHTTDTALSNSTQEKIAGSWQSLVLDPLNNDMLVTDETYFSYYAFDGIRGPCSDVNGNGVCDSPLDSEGFSIESESFNATHFLTPVGLPVHNTFKLYFQDGIKVTESSHVSLVKPLEIGPSAGISVQALHGDVIKVSMDKIHDYSFDDIDNEEPSGCGSMAVGGSFLDGEGAGVYSSEFYPCKQSQNSSGIPQPEDTDRKDRSIDVGFRCAMPLRGNFYAE